MKNIYYKTEHSHSMVCSMASLGLAQVCPHLIFVYCINYCTSKELKPRR